MRPSGSPCTVVAGPTWMTPRREVGTTKSSSCALPGVERRQDEAGRREADGQLDEDRQHRRARLVGDEDAAGRGLADDDPARVDLGEDAHLGAPEREGEADDEEHEGGRGHHEQLGPAPPRADDPADDAEARIVQPSGETHRRTPATGRQTPSVWSATCSMDRVIGAVIWRMPRLVGRWRARTLVVPWVPARAPAPARSLRDGIGSGRRVATTWPRSCG